MGDVQIETDLPEEKITNETFGIADSRCTDCEAKHGNFKAMSENYMKETGNTYEQFKVDIENAGGKKENIEAKIEEIKVAQQQHEHD